MEHRTPTTLFRVKLAPDQLKARSSQVQLLDARLPEDFEASHLVGAKNNCVLEVQFVSRLKELAPDREAFTVIYGPNGESHEAQVAFEKLTRAGYSDLHILDGGFAAASQILETEHGEALPPAPAAPDGRYSVDLHESRCEWTGRNLLNKHTGTVPFSSGYLDFEKGDLSGGQITMDLSQIQCADLTGSPMHQVLIDHLQSDDFFDVEHFPEVVVALGHIHQGKVAADVTIRGNTHHVSIPIHAGINDQGFPVAHGLCVIDRTKWGVIYGSKKFFHRLGGHFVRDEIELDLRIVTTR